MRGLEFKQLIAKLRGEEYILYSNDVGGELAVGAIYETLFSRWKITRHFNHGPQPHFGPDYGTMYEVWGKRLQSSNQTAIRGDNNE